MNKKATSHDKIPEIEPASPIHDSDTDVERQFTEVAETLEHALVQVRAARLGIYRTGGASDTYDEPRRFILDFDLALSIFNDSSCSPAVRARVFAAYNALRQDDFAYHYYRVGNESYRDYEHFEDSSEMAAGVVFGIDGPRLMEMCEVSQEVQKIVKLAAQGDNLVHVDALLRGFASAEEMFEKTLSSGELEDIEPYYQLELMKALKNETNVGMAVIAFLYAGLKLPEKHAGEEWRSLMGRSGLSRGAETSLFGYDHPIDGRIAGYRCALAKHVVDTIGLEGVALLRENCGIVGIDAILPGQAERMVRFVERDPELLGELQQKDVCVIFRDATGDYNGGLGSVHAEFETDGATLLFEVSGMTNGGEEMRRYMKLLAERDVHPAVVVLAGHGQPGRIAFGEGRLVSRGIDHITIYNEATLHDVGMGEFLANMKPDADGNCSVVFKSCSQAASVSKDNPDDHMLARAAEEYMEEYKKQNGDTRSAASYQFIGMANASNFYTNRQGVVQKVFEDTDLTRVIVGDYGNAYVRAGQYLEEEPIADIIQILPFLVKAGPDD